MKVSVALAAYNGEKYIAEQLHSILGQLRSDDEVIVSDDNPGGETERIVRETAASDKRIHYLEGPGQGVIKNFEYAISKTTGDIIFLSDQDDVWKPDKVRAITREIKDGAVLVLHNAEVTDESLNITEKSFFEIHGSKKGWLSNVIKNSYMGCCMAFDASLKEKILPFPKRLPMHDQYIGLVAEKYARRNGRRVVFLDTPYILYRQHGDNLTGGKTKLSDKIRWRCSIIIKTLFK